jgi:hypothetical protein
MAVGVCILPEPAFAGGYQIPRPRSRQRQRPRKLLTAQGMACLTNRAAPRRQLRVWGGISKDWNPHDRAFWCPASEIRCTMRRT